jgi:hypothetical protein
VVTTLHLGQSLELLSERLPGRFAAAADVARDDDAVLVEDGDRGVAEEPQRPGELDVRIRERRPGPAVLVQELLGRVRVVRDVQADVPVLGMSLDEPCVGDRLAVADGSPGCPDVDEHGLSPVVVERHALAVDGLAAERDPGLRSGPRRRPGRLPSPVRAAAAGREQDQQAEERRETHDLHDGS